MPSEYSNNIIQQLVTEYESSVKRLQNALAHYLKTGLPPGTEDRERLDFCYPELVITYRGKERETVTNLAFGKLEKVGTYRTTFTKPEMFADYVGEQLDLLIEQYELEISVGRSRQEIPFPYVLDGSADLELGTTSPSELARHFPTTELADIGDEIADGLLRVRGTSNSPLALFDALRTDFSLARLRHYTGAPAEHVQNYILFTNYHRYVDEFVSWACTQVGNGRYTALSGAGGLFVDQPTDNAAQLVADSTWRRHQMPAYHLMAPDRSGITLVNIGVGPSNAKTICDHLAVMRPEAWLMIGHCGGLRETQRI